MIFANMHNHSTFSDACYTPEKLIELGKSIGHGAVVLTDHDTVRGTYYMQKAARKAGMYTLLGCEFSTVGLGTDFHLLGFDFNPDWPEMRRLLDYCAKKQYMRSKQLFDWAVEAGTLKDITWEEVQNAFPTNDYICNDQVYMVMKAKGVIDHKDDAFRKAFSYNPHERELLIEKITGMHYPNVEDVIRIVREAGGVPVVAHPHNQIEYIEPLLEKGLMGIETNFPGTTAEESAELNRIADEKGLYKTGGTDHSYVLGGGGDSYGRYSQELCGASEEDFMKLYKRTLG